MSLYFLDSLTPPDAAAAAQAAHFGYVAWGGYVAGDGIPAESLWTPEDVDVLRQAGLGFLPIVAPDWALDQDAQALALAGVTAALHCGSAHVIALDTEYQERTNPHLVLTVDGWCRRLQANGWVPVVYRGGGYAGPAIAWTPRWTAPSGTKGPVPQLPARGAVQFAGGVSVAGMTVDISAYDLFPDLTLLPVTSVL